MSSSTDHDSSVSRTSSGAPSSAAARSASSSQHDAGKLTARERIDLLFDPGHLRGARQARHAPLPRLRHGRRRSIPGDGVVTGHGRVDGRPVYAFAQDFTVFGGSLSETNAAKICKIMDLAMKIGAPVVGLNDSGGARIQEGVVSLGGYADIFLRNTLASGVVPQISAIMGPCAGGAVYSPAITDFIVMVEGTSYMFVTGPDVIKTVTHEEVTKEELGGAMTHNATSGVAHFAVPDDRECLRLIRELLSLPAVATTSTIRRGSATTDPVDREDEALDRLVPGLAEPALRHARPDPRGRRRRRVPRGAPALRAEHRRRLRAPRRPLASASSPTSRRISPARSTSTRRSRRRASSASATPSTSRSSRSRTCPASCPARVQEYGGIIRHGAKLLYAFAEATVPKVTVITRKAYGGAYCVMSSKHIRTDVNFAWPTRGDRGDGARGRGQHPLQARARQGRRPGRPRAPRASPSSARSSPTPTSPPRAASSTK